MSGTLALHALPTHGVPPDLQLLRSRLADMGVSVRLPTSRAGYRLPPPWEMAGESLTDTVIGLRGRDAEA